MEKTISFNELISQLPKNLIFTYSHPPTSTTNIPYTLTVKGFSDFYLDETKLPNLTLNEQLILLNSTNRGNKITPELTIAGIFKAREIKKRSTDEEDALQKCHIALVNENQAWLTARRKTQSKVDKLRAHSNKLEYYLINERLMESYNKAQKSKFRFLIQFKNKLLEAITKKPYTKPPVSQEELNEGRKVWKAFRKKQNPSSSISDEQLLRRYRYNSDSVHGHPFEFMMDSDEINALLEEYTTTNLALQILDGSELKKAKSAISKNSFQYLKKFKAMCKTPENR